MGGKMVVPEANVRMKRAMKTFALTNSDIGKLWGAFNKVDTTRIGKITLVDIFKGYEIEHWRLLGESLMALVDIELDEQEPACIDFADFTTAICTLLCFEPPQLLRFCMYCFDPEKNGYISIEDLKALMNDIHGVLPPATVIGNEKKSWSLLEFPVNGKIEFDDIQEIHQKVPMLLKPAFRFQEKVCNKYLGVPYWEKKKRSLYEGKLRADKLLEKKKARKKKKANAGKDRKIKKRMGLLRYYMCPCIRFMYDPEDESRLTDEQKADKIRLARLEQLAAKNPVTSAWKKYEKKVESKFGGNEDYAVEKQLKTERHREARQMGRAERKAQRAQHDDLKHHPSAAM